MIGHGLTAKPAEGYEAVDYARHVVAFMDAAGIERAHVAGESLGGWVAHWVALLYPERVNKLISITGTALAVETDEASKQHFERGIAELVRLGHQFVQNPTRENLRARLAWLFHDPDRDISEELIDLRWKIYEHMAAMAAPAKPEPKQEQPQAKGAAGND
jgi:pimeloyl-ACP methyl ester carboxylesterase